MTTLSLQRTVKNSCWHISYKFRFFKCRVLH